MGELGVFSRHRAPIDPLPPKQSLLGGVGRELEGAPVRGTGLIGRPRARSRSARVA